jgi:hypothetical protein
LAEAAVNSALLGVERARPTARQLMTAVLEQGTSVDLILRYSRLGTPEGREIISALRNEVAALQASVTPDMRILETTARIAVHLANWYLLPEAIDLLFELSLLDRRMPRRQAGHPIRQIQELVSEFHPEMERNQECRTLVSSRVDAWIASRQSDVRAWEVYGAVLGVALSLKLSGRFLDPANQRSLQLVETVTLPEETQRIYEDVWPLFEARLGAAPPETIKAAIEQAAEWLHIGSGYDRPFGRAHGAAAVRAAKQYGRKLMVDLRSLAEGQPGLAMLLNNNVKTYGIRMGAAKVQGFYETFLQDTDRAKNREQREAKVLNEVERLARPWASESPSDVVARLVTIRAQLSLAQISWPPRVMYACDVIARETESVLSWVEASLDEGLFPDGHGFIKRALRAESGMPSELLDRCLNEPSARWSTLDAALSNEVSEDVVAAIASALQPSDLTALEASFARNDLSSEQERILLSQPRDEVRGIVALALLVAKRQKNAWPDSRIESDWVAAAGCLDFSTIDNGTAFPLRSFFPFLREEYPGVLLDLAVKMLQQIEQDSTLVPLEARKLLSQLPPSVKTTLLERFTSSLTRWILLRHLPGRAF